MAGDRADLGLDGLQAGALLAVGLVLDGLLALFLGADLLVDRDFQLHDLAGDALGLVVDQLGLGQHRALDVLAQVLERGAEADQPQAGLAGFLVALGGGAVEGLAFQLGAQLGEACGGGRVFGDGGGGGGQQLALLGDRVSHGSGSR